MERERGAGCQAARIPTPAVLGSEVAPGSLFGTGETWQPMVACPLRLSVRETRVVFGSLRTVQTWAQGLLSVSFLWRSRAVSSLREARVVPGSSALTPAGSRTEVVDLPGPGQRWLIARSGVAGEKQVGECWPTGSSHPAHVRETSVVSIIDREWCWKGFFSLSFPVFGLATHSYVYPRLWNDGRPNVPKQKFRACCSAGIPSEGSPSYKYFDIAGGIPVADTCELPGSWERFLDKVDANGKHTSERQLHLSMGLAEKRKWLSSGPGGCVDKSGES
ncbi:hypothetical protein DFP73DRAFT_524693 [Morchella snyderi]|nr:hypothetical protein DFP73DRAFT_524693 [Morchella snyderi]